MIREAIFLRGGPVVGGYLDGIYRWGYAVRLSSVRVECIAPTEGALTLELRIGGAAAGETLTVPPSGRRISLERALDRIVPAGATVRWSADYAGDIGAAARSCSLVMGVQRLENAPGQTRTLNVLWEDGGERFLLFVQEGGVFSDVSDGLSVGRASVSQSGPVMFSIHGLPVLRGGSGRLKTNGFFPGGPPPTGPRLRFRIGARSVGLAGLSGFYAPNAAQAASDGGFDIGGVRLNESGVFAPGGFEQPI